MPGQNVIARHLNAGSQVPLPLPGTRHQRHQRLKLPALVFTLRFTLVVEPWVSLGIQPESMAGKLRRCGLAAGFNARRGWRCGKRAFAFRVPHALGGGRVFQARPRGDAPIGGGCNVTLALERQWLIVYAKRVLGMLERSRTQVRPTGDRLGCTQHAPHSGTG
uniref:Uncharacterized protein n=1 Tax=Ralstonia syzygii R24 TaxID=907261 RepID=G3ABC6_9RALS|nr:hypothetical protein RALSY_mp30126 [Ralstonia syzygii R24]